MLPILEIKGAIQGACQNPGFQLLIKAPTGSGKSTQVPQFLHEAGISSQGAIIVVQPRRIAARLLARHVAKSFNEPVGRTVGYVVRFERQISSETSIIFLTDGMLERWMIDNPSLNGISAIVFDEFHERSLSGDLCLGRALDLQKTTRPDLGLVIMSATIELDLLSNSLGDNAQCLEAQGRCYPVEIDYLPAKQRKNIRGVIETPAIWEQAVSAIASAIKRGRADDVLIFMPGAYEIRKTVEALKSQSWLSNWDIVELHGSLSPDLQNKAVESGTRPKVIVSTNVAETSLTIEGVRTVIDSGLVRLSGWDPFRAMNTLRLEKTSQASADQRTGRAGRVQEGLSLRLWSKTEQEKRISQTLPELFRVDLSGALLTLHEWGYAHWQEFPWFNEPPTDVLNQGESLLKDLGALGEDGHITEIGRQMMAYPLPPRLARFMIEAREKQCYIEAAAITSLLHSERIAHKSGLNPDWWENDDFTDFQAEWRAAIAAYENQFDARYCTQWGISARAAREIWQSYNQLIHLEVKGNMKEIPLPDFQFARSALIDSLLTAYGDHVGVKNGIAANTCKLVGNKSGKIDATPVLKNGIIFLAGEVAELSGKQTETKISRNTLIELSDLERYDESLFEETVIPLYDETRRRVMNRRQISWKGLMLLNQDKGDADPSMAAPILAEKVIDGTLKLTKWDNSVDQWIRRVNLLSKLMLEYEVPEFTEADSLLALSLVCEDAIGYKDIKDREILPILKDWLSPWQQDVLEKEIPQSLLLENGQKVKIHYSEDGLPELSSTMQRLIGVKTTPSIAQGRQKVKIILLAPNQRPWQTTDSIERFWDSGYIHMKKDLAGRYPKHKWPSDEEIRQMHAMK